MALMFEIALKQEIHYFESHGTGQSFGFRTSLEI